jgi:hypothetical protein
MSKHDPASAVATDDERCAYPGCGKIAGTVEHHCTYPAHHDQEREPNTGCHAFVARKAGVYEHAGGIVMGPRYLGDGVYVAIERGMLKLYTSDGISETNVIFLEPSVMDALMDYYREAAQEPKQ